MTAIERIRGELAAATPGPWGIDTEPGFEHHVRTAGTSTTTPMWEKDRGVPVADCALNEDATLIANAPTYLAALLDVAEQVPRLHFQRPTNPFWCICGREWPCKLDAAFDALDALGGSHE